MIRNSKFTRLGLLLLCSTLTGNALAVQTTAMKSQVVQQDGKCKGLVKDDAGEPIIGATVKVKGQQGGTITDINGEFSLGNVKKGDIIQISYVGFETKETAWNGTMLNITLTDDSRSLNEVVVVGFGTQKKVNLTGSVATVSSKEIMSRPVNNVTDALQGVVPGMNFSVGAGGGQLNSQAKFNIRGTGTIGSGSSVSPLVLIDGMEGDINTLNPQDVENISVLKDASASSIYGSRAAGGVILITTKSGKVGKATVNYNNSFRFGSPMNMPKMLDSYSWALYMNDASRYSGNGTWFNETKLNQIKAAQSDPNAPTMFANNNNRWELWDGNDILPVGNTDWYKFHFGNSFSQEHNISINGGNEDIRYYLSGNMLDRNGILKHGNDTRRRYGLTAKIDAQITKWAKVIYNARFTRTDFDAPTQLDDNMFYHNVARYWPIIPAKDPNGHWNTVSFVELLENGGRHKDQDDVFAQQLTFRLTPIKGLVVNAEFNYRIDNYNQHKDWLTTYGYDVNNNSFVDANQNSAVYEYNKKVNYFNPNIYAEYSFSLKDLHNFKVMAGYQSEELRQKWFSGEQKGILSKLPTLHTTATDPKVDGKPESWSTVGIFGRLNYDYMGRYLLEANFRYDGSSRFLRKNRWNVFPSFSAGWNIAQEQFWKPVEKYVNTLKLRASWGQLGNQNTDNWYPFYPTISYTNQGGTWLVNGTKPNISSEPALVSSTLTWEKSRTWDIGFDFGAFNNRLTGSFDYFQRKTYDMVGPAPELPAILGANAPKVNNLDMTSKGWELTVSWRDQIRDFSYGIALMLSDNKVFIDKYPNESKSLSTTYNNSPIYPGAQLGEIWGYTTVGIAKTNEEMNNHLATANQSALGSNWAAGDIMFADLNGDNKVNNGKNTAEDSGDLRIIGNSTPRYNFGLNLTAAWKGFDLKVFFQGVLKRDYYPGKNDAVFWGASGISKWQATGFKEHLDYFRDDPDSPLGLNLDSYYPRANWGGGRNNHTQTKYLQNAAYCRLKNLTLGYTLPRSVTSKFYVQNLRVFISAENLFTITSFTKLGDPEIIDVSAWGFSKQYPLSKTFSIGASVTF